MKLVNLDQQIFVPVVDETNGGATYEMQMTVGEFFDKCCEGFKPETVDAIPVAYMKEEAGKYEYGGCIESAIVIEKLIIGWQQEQEAKA